MSWKTERLSAFNQMKAEWGVAATVGVKQAIGIKTPDVTDRVMMGANYQPVTRCSFDISRSDFQLLELAPRVQFTCGGINYEVGKVSDDAADATIGFSAIRVK